MGLNSLEVFSLLVYSIMKICPLPHTSWTKFLLNLWSSTSFLKIQTSNEEKLTATLWLLARSHNHEWKGLCNWRIICYSTFLAWLLSICSFNRAVLIYINTCLLNLEVQWLVFSYMGFGRCNHVASQGNFLTANIILLQFKATKFF